MKYLNIIYIFVLFISKLVIITLETNETEIGTSYEINIGVCLDKYSSNVKFFEFYFQFNDYLNNHTTNSSTRQNEMNMINSCSDSCCDMNNIYCEFYLFSNVTKKCYEYSCAQKDCLDSDTLNIFLILNEQNNQLEISFGNFSLKNLSNTRTKRYLIENSNADDGIKNDKLMDLNIETNLVFDEKHHANHKEIKPMIINFTKQYANIIKFSYYVIMLFLIIIILVFRFWFMLKSRLKSNRKKTSYYEN
jgi:hypothetical protein